MPIVVNPTTGELEWQEDDDPLNEHKGVGGGDGKDNSFSSVGVDPSTLDDPTKFDWKSALDKAVKFFSTPQGIAGLAGAGLGYLDRPKPYGGGTTMAYPGAAQLERKMVQGPYGPLAQYTGVGGGTPDYTPFTAPKVEFPTVGSRLTPPSDSGMSMQAKVDYYKTLKSYGLSDDRVRRIAETLFGPQTDAAWASLKNAVGSSPAESGIAAPVASPAPAPRTAAPVASPAVGGGNRSGFTRDPNAIGASVMRPWYNPKTGQTYMASDSAWSPPNSDWVQGTPPAAGDESAEVDAGRGHPALGAPANPALFSQQPSFTRLSRSSSPSEISAAYDEFVASRGGDTEANRAEALQFLQSKGVSQSKINDAYSKFQKGETVAEVTGLPKKDWEKEATFAARETPGSKTLGVWRDPTSGKGIAVQSDSRGQPAHFRYINEEGVALNSTAFNAKDLYETADKLGMDLSNIWQLGDLLDEKKVKYKPYELYQGTGSDHGIDFKDIAQGGLGTAYDWTKDPLAYLKGESGAKTLAGNQAVAQQLGVTKNPFVTTERGIDPERFTTLMAGNQPRSNIAYTGGTASWYDTPEQAQQYLAGAGGGQQYSTASGAPTLVSNQGTIAPAAPGYMGLTSESAPTGIASAYNEFISSRGGDTEENRAEALKFLQSKGIAQPAINQAYDVFKQGKFAHGGHVQMEDGGFVMTKRAVDGAGGPRGIQQLVPGARMIRGPGTGTSDDVPAVINGRNGQTPARLSNGEAYVPKRFVQDQGGPQQMYALMNNLQRKA